MPAPAALDLETPVREGFTTVTTFLPRLLGFLVILGVGYVLAKALEKLVARVLERVGFDRAVERGGVKQALARSSVDASDLVAKLVFFAVFLAALSMAVGTLGIDAVREPLAAFLALIPQLIVAVVLVVIGAVLAAAAKRFLANLLAGLSYAGLLANAAAVIVLFGFVKAALDEVGIAEVVTTALLYTALASVAGIAVVGVGGGLIRPMQARWESLLDKADTEKDKVRTAASMNRGAYPGEPPPATSAMDAPTASLRVPPT